VIGLRSGGVAAATVCGSSHTMRGPDLEDEGKPRAIILSILQRHSETFRDIQRHLETFRDRGLWFSEDSLKF